MHSTHDSPKRWIRIAVLFVGVGLLFSALRSYASWEYIPLEVRIIEADLVVAGEVLPVYRATHLIDRQPIESLAELRGRIAAIEEIRWGAPKDGLQLGIFTEQRDLRDTTIRIEGEVVSAVAQLTVYPLLKNVGDKPIYVNMFQRDMPFSILCYAPNGRPMEVASPDRPCRQDRFASVYI